MNTVLGRAAVLMAFLLGAAAAMYSQQGAMQTQRIAQFENEDVKVWKSVILPNAPLTMHRHEHPRVIVALSGGTMNIVQQSGPAGTVHADVNAGDKPIEVMVVELKHEN
jgi:hypothetical protein